MDLPALFAPHELAEIWVFHPEPCTKPNEQSNRLLSSQFLAMIQVLLAPGGRLAIKTDHPGYFQSLLALFDLPDPAWFNPANRNEQSPKLRLTDLLTPAQKPSPSPEVTQRFEIALRSDNLWNDPPAQTALASRHFAGRTTHYESRFRAKRQPIFFLDLRARSSDEVNATR